MRVGERVGKVRVRVKGRRGVKVRVEGNENKQWGVRSG